MREFQRANLSEPAARLSGSPLARRMRPYLLLSLVFVLCAFTLDASETSGFKLIIGGGIGGRGPNFYVSLNREGHLRVRRTGLPIVSPGKLTESATSIHIKPSEAKKLIALAEASQDFSVGCQPVPDGTSAHLSLATGRGTVERKCTAAGSWPNGPKTRDFLKNLNSKLPQKFQVF